jgi:putative Mg2+ transporter-C (MgtC) family protein
MDNFLSFLIGQSEWNNFAQMWLPIGFRVFVAILCGGIIGVEREWKHKPAGLRTNILICLGAMLYTTLSLLITQHATHGQPSDPGRIAAQVVTGIGFLGGGMIIQSGGAVTGLTSAATVWIVAAIGVCIGLGYPITALIFTLTVLFTLFILSKVDAKLFGKIHGYELWILFDGKSNSARERVMQTFQESDLDLSHLMVTDSNEQCQVHARYYTSEARHLRIQAGLWSVPQVDRIDIKVT